MKSCLVILSSLSQLSLFVFLLLIIDFHFKFTTCNWAAAAALLSSSCTYLLGILSTARKYIFICFVFFGLRWLWKLAQVGLPFWSWDREKETEGGREGGREWDIRNGKMYFFTGWIFEHVIVCECFEAEQSSMKEKKSICFLSFALIERDWRKRKEDRARFEINCFHCSRYALNTALI